MKQDTSAVFHLATLDQESQKHFDSSLPWLFETDVAGCIQFRTEAAACMRQRIHRRQNGFDPMTGTRVNR